MNILKIKYFPSNFFDYFIILSINLILNFIFLILLNNFNSFLAKKNTLNDFYLFIPKNIEDFTEKKDLIFKRLSLEKNILSVSKIQEDHIISILENNLEKAEIPEALIPDVYSVEVKNKKEIEISNLNKTIDEIIPNSKLYKKNKKIVPANYLKILPSIILLQIIFNYLLLKLSFKNLSRMFFIVTVFGSSRTNSFFKLSCGYVSVFLLSNILACVSIILSDLYQYSFPFEIKISLKSFQFITYLVLNCVIKILTLYVVFNNEIRKIYN